MGLVQLYLGEEKEAYDAFFKATWSNEQQEMSFYYLAAIDARCGRFAHALEMVEKGLVKNVHNIKARGLKAYILRKLGKTEAAKAWITENIALDPFDFVSGNEAVILAGGDSEEKAKLHALMRNFAENYLMSARDYADAGAYKEAAELLADCTNKTPLVWYYEGYYLAKAGKEAAAIEKIKEAENMAADYCFPNKLEDIAVLSYAIEKHDAAMANYYLGNLYYDKLQWEKSIALWEVAREKCPSFPTVYRNLSLAYYNKKKDKAAAREAMEKAFALDTSDVRVFLELDQLYKKLEMSFADRLKNYEAHRDIIGGRDDLFIEYITLINMTGNHARAYELIMNRKFHPWEGGEGKITTQYTLALLEMAKQALRDKDAPAAESMLRKALVYPENLGEGKLEGTKDNHIYYHLGLALERQGKVKEAKKCYEMASIGTDEPAGMMYYNDQRRI